MGRWLAIDYGSKRIGVAAGSTGDAIASPLEVISAQPLDQAIGRVLQLAREYSVEGIVVGWPLNMDDSEGPQGKLVREVAVRLAAATKLDVRLWDERLSSFDADQALAGLFTRKKKKQRQDALAAASILRDFLQSGGVEKARRPADISDRSD